MSSDNAHQPEPGAVDPWRSFRGVVSAIVILEIIVVLLALPVISESRNGLSGWSLTYVVGFAVVLVLLMGISGRPWALWVNLGAQLIPIIGFMISAALGFIGILFVLVWAVIAYLRAEVIRRQRRGLLSGGQPPS